MSSIPNLGPLPLLIPQFCVSALGMTCITYALQTLESEHLRISCLVSPNITLGPGFIMEEDPRKLSGIVISSLTCRALGVAL